MTEANKEEAEKTEEGITMMVKMLVNFFISRTDGIVIRVSNKSCTTGTRKARRYSVSKLRREVTLKKKKGRKIATKATLRRAEIVWDMKLYKKS